jgi:hypothetical protein
VTKDPKLIIKVAAFTKHNKDTAAINLDALHSHFGSSHFGSRHFGSNSAQRSY